MHQLVSLIRVIINQLRFILMKARGVDVVCSGKCTSRLDNEWSVSKNATIRVGKHMCALGRCRFLVRKGAKLKIGDEVGLNTNCIIACHESVSIGDGAEIGPNVCIYDHDHDFRCEGGIRAGKYRTAPVTIGRNVWIGANSVILKGTTLGDNCVIAAGSVVRGNVPENTVYYLKHTPEMKPIEVNR